MKTCLSVWSLRRQELAQNFLPVPYIRFSPHREANRHFPICLRRTAYYDDNVTVELSAVRQPIIIHIRLAYTYLRIVKNCLESNIENSRSILYKIVPIYNSDSYTARPVPPINSKYSNFW